MCSTLAHPNMHAAGGVRAALVVGHPGHELRVYGWLTAVQPVVHVFTDGSGSDGVSRLDSTSALLDEVGASRGSVYGRMTDREIYGAMLAGDHARFIALAEELAASLLQSGANFVAGDAIEGFNPSHDVCRYVINAAVRLASAASGRAIPCCAFALAAAPDACETAARPLQMSLDDRLLDRKLQAARAYAELRPEVEAALARHGAEAFRRELLWPIDLADRYGWDPARVPYYEAFGAERVRAGTYDAVVTFREHVRPLADALWCHSVAAV
jgi:hypothetical protein